jgi:hypothetical protein
MRVRKTAKSDYLLGQVCPSVHTELVRRTAESDYLLGHVCPSVHTELAFLWTVIKFEDFSKICRENSSAIIIGQE